MLLFKPEHVKPIQDGIKTATRRQWKKCRVKVGSVHLCKTKMLSKDYFAKVRIVKTYKQKLKHMVMEDYLAEGGYIKEEYINKWREINGTYDKDEIVWVVKFELVR